MAEKISWRFPKNNFIFRIEAAFVAFLALVIFVGTLFYYDYQLVYPIAFTFAFLVLYVLSAAIINFVRGAEEHYLGHKTHLEITKKRKHFVEKLKIPWKDVHRHKLDKFFFGGYLLMKDKKRHPLYFNTRKEVERFEGFIEKFLKKK